MKKEIKKTKVYVSSRTWEGICASCNLKKKDLRTYFDHSREFDPNYLLCSSCLIMDK